MKIRGIILLLGIVLNVGAQDLPDLTNYQHNWLIFNPAFTGSQEALSVNFFSRDKAGFGAAGRATPVPKYFQFGFHSPFSRWENASYGLSWYNMKQPGTGIIGLFGGSGASVPMSEHNLSAYYSYKVFAFGGSLSFGLSAMGSYESVDYGSLDVRQLGDPQFLAGIDPEFKYNFGAGMLYYHPNGFFVAASVPRLLIDEADTASFSGNGSTLQPVAQYRNYNYMVTSGFRIRNGSLTFYPSALAGYIPSAGIRSLNYMASFNMGFMNEKLWIGTIYKSSKEISANLNISLQPWILLGFSWDFPLQQVTGYFDNSFEIILRIENRQRKAIDVPFYF